MYEQGKQRKTKASQLISKALKQNDEARELIRKFKSEGYDIENESLIDETRNRINEISKKTRFSTKDMDLLSDYASVTQYDYIKVKMDIRPETDDDISVPAPKEISLKDIRLALRRQVLGSNLSEQEQQIITQYSRSVAQSSNQEAPDLTTPEGKKAFKEKFSVIRDTAIGGASTLINDLSYTYDAKWLGRNFVETLQKLMRNKNIFIEIEAWYQENADVQDLIQDAVKDRWYDNYNQFSAAIIEFVNEIPKDNLDAESKYALDVFTATAEGASAEEA